MNIMVKDKLRIGDYSNNGQIEILDEDRLCYLVKSTNRGTSGYRTISKALLNEFVDYLEQNPNSVPRDAREALSGKSEIDKYEYGYESTLHMMAKMVLRMENVNHTVSMTANQLADNISYLPYLTALRTKPFMLLAGISGTGKSRIVRKLAQATNPKEYKNEEDRWKDNRPENFELIQVKPNWHNSMDVVGYMSNIPALWTK